MFEQSVNNKHGCEIAKRQRSRPKRRTPQIKQLVTKENGHQQPNGNPFVSQRPGPNESRLKNFSCDIPNQQKWASQAEEISRTQQHENQRAAKVDPRQNRRKIFRGQRKKSPMRLMRSRSNRDDCAEKVCEFEFGFPKEF
jgi:hypothetical protein